MNSKHKVAIPFLILFYFFFHYVSDLFYFLDLWKVVLQVVKYFIVTGLLFWVGYKIFRNKDRYILIFSTLLFLFLFFGSLMKTAAIIGLLKSFEVVTMKILLGYIGICLLIIIFFTWLRISAVINFLKFWIVYCFVLIVFDAGVLLFTKKDEKKYLSKKYDDKKLPLEKKTEVFYLLFDMYPSDTALYKFMNFDNSELNTFLKTNGFFVTGDARSIYMETYYSLGSTLNLAPLDYLNDKSVNGYKKSLLAIKNIKYNRLLEIFSSSGYTIRNYSVFDLQDQESLLSFNMRSHLNNALTSSTSFNWMYYSFEPDLFKSNRNIDLGFLKKSWSTNIKSDLTLLQKQFYGLLKKFPNAKQKGFNYFHFNMPHPPVLYDSAGNDLGVKDMYALHGYERAKNNYLNYIKYVNGEIRKMVNSIIRNVGKDVVIIIQGDHGYREFPHKFPDEMRLGIYNAVYLPENNYIGFTDTMTPIATFKKMLANQYDYLLP